jgi:hypothetical protein
VLRGSMDSTLSFPHLTSLWALKELYDSIYQKFVSETEFETKCRALLDLFKLQIVFAGIFSD